MGLGSLLGIKQVKFKTKEALDLQELFEKIKDVKFDAGVPKYIKHGFGYIIAWPKVDNENQVWLTGSKGSFVIQRSTMTAGTVDTFLDGLSAEIENELTLGASGLNSAFGEPKKVCMAQVDSIAEVINGLNL